MNPETQNNSYAPPPAYTPSPQGYVPQEGYAPPPQGYVAAPPQQGYVAAPAYTAQPVGYVQPTVQYAQPTVVVQQPAIVQTTYSNDDGKDDVMPSLLIFIIGWFCCCVWCAGWKWIKSPNPSARLFAILSVVMAFLGGASIIIGVVVGVVNTATAAAAAANDPYYN